MTMTPSLLLLLALGCCPSPRRAAAFRPRWMVLAVLALFGNSVYQLERARPRLSRPGSTTMGGGGGAMTTSFEEDVRRAFAASPRKTAELAVVAAKNRAPAAAAVAAVSSPSSRSLPRILAIYFPQYHTDPVNDRNWGVNFTDWVSLRGAPLTNRMGFPIPRPTTTTTTTDEEFELGYYDLTDVSTRKKQGQLAYQHGVDGFLYHHYWFYDPTHPGPTLGRPLELMLQDGYPNLPFAFNWCATKWVNVWMGKAIFQKRRTTRNNALTLQEQYFNGTHDAIRDHYTWLAQFFHHPNYITVHGEPVLVLYYFDVRAIPVLKELRRLAVEDGFSGLYLIVGRQAYPPGLYDPSHILNGTNNNDSNDSRLRDMITKRMQSLDVLQAEAGPIGEDASESTTTSTTPSDVVFNQSMTYPYPLEYVNRPLSVPKWCQDGLDPDQYDVDPNEVTGIVTAFDNTPRREAKSATLYNNYDVGSPDDVLRRFETNLYAALLYHKCCRRRRRRRKAAAADADSDDDDRFVAINSWNEWAEGMAIEPSDVYGRRWLEVIRDVKRRVGSEQCPFHRDGAVAGAPAPP